MTSEQEREGKINWTMPSFKKTKTCFCVGADKCSDTKCKLVKEYRKKQKIKEQSMIPNEQEIREAIKEVEKELSHIACDRSEKTVEAIKILLALAQSYLSANKELPERKDSCIAHKVFREDCQECMENYTFNSCLDQVTPIVAKKNEEVARLKKENEGYKNLIKNCPQAQVCPYVKTISFTPDLELAKKVIEEQREELKACRDANVQKKKLIAELEDALKRAEERIKELEYCSCGKRLSIGKCSICDNDD